MYLTFYYCLVRHKTKSTHKSGTSGATVEDSVRNSKKVVDKLPKETSI